MLGFFLRSSLDQSQIIMVRLNQKHGDFVGDSELICSVFSRTNWSNFADSGGRFGLPSLHQEVVLALMHTAVVDLLKFSTLRQSTCWLLKSQQISALCEPGFAVDFLFLDMAWRLFDYPSCDQFIAWTIMGNFCVGLQLQIRSEVVHVKLQRLRVLQYSTFKSGRWWHSHYGFYSDFIQ